MPAGGFPSMQNGMVPGGPLGGDGMAGRNGLPGGAGVNQQLLAYLQANTFEPNSTLGMYAIFAPQNLARVQTGIREELALAARDGFSASEVEEAKRALVRIRSQTVYYVLTRIKSICKVWLDRERMARVA